MILLQASDRPTDENGPGPWPVRWQTLGLLGLLAVGQPIPLDVEATSLMRANRLLAVYARWLLSDEPTTFAGLFPRSG